MQDSNLAESGSVGPVEDISEDFSKMNRGQDAMTESERAKKLEQRLGQAEEERTMLRQELEEKNATINVLREKSTPELLKELQEKFPDTPGLIDAKKLQKDMYLFSILYKNRFGVKTFLNHQTLRFAITRKRIREKFFRKHQGHQNGIVPTQSSYLKRQKPYF